MVPSLASGEACPYGVRVFVYEFPESLHFNKIAAAARERKIGTHFEGEHLLAQFALEFVLADFFEQACVRTHDPDAADFFFVPFFSDVEYRAAGRPNGPSPHGEAILDILERNDTKKWVDRFETTDKYWRRAPERHVLVQAAPVTGFRHPKGRRGWHHYKVQLGAPIFVSVEVSRSWTLEYPRCSAKNVVMPYPVPGRAWHDNTDNGWAATGLALRDSRDGARPILAMYRGGRHGCVNVRQSIADELAKAPDVAAASALVDARYRRIRRRGPAPRQAVMQAAVFCPCPEGDSPSAKRQYDALLAGCVPVLVSDDALFAYDHRAAPAAPFFFNSSTFSLRIREQDALDHGILPTLRAVDPATLEALQRRGRAAAPYYRYYAPGPNYPDDPLPNHRYPDGGALALLVADLDHRASRNLVEPMWHACRAELRAPHLDLTKHIATSPRRRDAQKKRWFKRSGSATVLVGAAVVVGVLHMSHWHLGVPGWVGELPRPAVPSRPRGRFAVAAKRAEIAERLAILERRQQALARLRAGLETDVVGAAPELTDYFLLRTTPSGEDEEGACRWIEHDGVDLFRGTCDLATVENSENCGSSCDETNACVAWTRLGRTCYLKACTAAGPHHEISGATSALRANHTRCAELRGIARAEPPRAWLERWRVAYGTQTFESHRRQKADADMFGPIVTVRGERHSGTNWVRAMVSENCPTVPHRLSPYLDSDGAYGWKHGGAPQNWSPDTKDAMIVLIRSAAAWLPKMKRVAYNSELDARGRAAKSLSAYVRVPFVDNYDTRRYASVVDLRTAKYKDYRDLALRAPRNVFAVRYEDLVERGASYLFRAIEAHLPACDARAFVEVKSYAKFGATNPSKPHVEHVPDWTQPDWNALLSRLDANLETDLGYVYEPATPGDFDVNPPPTPTWLRLPSASETPTLLAPAANTGRRRRRRVFFVEATGYTNNSTSEGWY
ncbi:hypothetical protein CTAYLR_008643 [Chrysophaeum taylorii]|uniref:Exostosin GT47 domain-containing protein n=1 Tax=Chrysophaeum taylorii TaxID=2483200 RepID=A0AAD7U6R4_9STRA|nr:hypothetical protein CTAYLR_008643 [Chrysophaeum taylorii]